LPKLRHFFSFGSFHDDGRCFNSARRTDNVIVGGQFLDRRLDDGGPGRRTGRALEDLGGTGSTASRVSAWQPLLVGSCRVANAEAVAAARALGDPPEPPSCTFVAAVLDGDLVATAWCGDSRAYWLPDDGEGEQLTVDHSLGTQLIRSGLTPEEAEADPRSHTITRWLGADSVDPTPEFRAVVLDRPGWLLVCSDGMWNYASSPAELSALLARAAADGATTATARAESLAAFANGCGGRDNITVALARWEPPLPSTPTAAEGS